eukprot:TRINITY_DN95895_c0_g1_i1.p2 TRINITY_DN95895_c0_g1~~TRINITY_DN95895_c0_g1_i1.p2  ORF type:complete len:160 (+),score=29.70 TRINITY_DN95895_c0_g1_i1:46-525(+)
MGQSACSCNCTGKADNLEISPYVTPEQFAEQLDSVAQSDSPDGKAGPSVRINADVIETILLDASGPKSEFVNSEEVQNAIQQAPRASRVSERKGTGFITKQKMMEILSEVDDDEESDSGGKAEVADGKGKRQQRSSNRKHTPFVTKQQLQKVIDAAGEV